MMGLSPASLQQGGVDGGYGKEYRRPVMADCFKNDFSRGLARHQNGAGAYSGREIEAIAQTVGEEQLRGGEGRVIGRNPQYALGVALQAMHHVMVQVDSCFWPARAARRVEPEGWIVSPGGSGRS